MRTTVTLDSDVEAILRRLMAERGLGFKEVLNDAVRRGTRSAQQETLPRFQTRTHNMGAPLVNLDKALQLAGQLEDEEILRKMRLGK